MLMVGGAQSHVKDGFGSGLGDVGDDDGDGDGVGVPRSASVHVVVFHVLALTRDDSAISAVFRLADWDVGFPR